MRRTVAILTGNPLSLLGMGLVSFVILAAALADVIAP